MVVVVVIVLEDKISGDSTGIFNVERYDDEGFPISRVPKSGCTRGLK
jgi:hypothetical protein